MSDGKGPQAPEGKVFVCLACGKQAKDKYYGGISKSWDESCMLNSDLFDVDKLVVKDGLVREILK